VTAKKLVIISNLGTPEAPTAKAVRPYLREFLMDPYVIDKPFWFRFLLVNLIIAPLRSSKSAKAYKKVWTEEGSPLLVYTQNLVDKIKPLLGEEFEVRLGMRYGNPSIQSTADNISEDIKKVYFLPLYPQYAESSTQTAIDEFNKQFQDIDLPKYILKPFYKENRFINLESQIIQKEIDLFEPDHVLFSYHGLPERHILKLDKTCNDCLKRDICRMKETDVCYRSHCFQTTDAIVNRIDLKIDYSTSFQSRLGRDPWIKPYTDNVIEEIAKKHKRVLVACPAFTSDCLETLEEIAMELKEEFIEFGGEDLKLVPSLNDSDDWAQVITSYLEDESSFDQIVKKKR